MSTIILSANYYKPHIGGVENSLFYLANEYQKLGKNVIILTSDKGLSRDERLPREELENNIKVLRYNNYLPFFYLDHVLKPIIDIYRGKKLLETIIKRNNTIECFIARSPNSVMFSVMKNLKTIYLVPGIAKIQNQTKKPLWHPKNLFINLIINNQKSFFQKIALKRANTLVVFSNNMSNQIDGFLNKKTSVKLVSPGLDTDKFKINPNISLEGKLGINSKYFVFLIVGRLIREKGIDTAIKCFAKAENSTSILLIVGDGPERNSLENLVNDLELDHKIFFMGSVSINIEEYYQIADCYIMSSITETFGQTIIEALAAGLPIIAWKSSNIIRTATSEIIENKRNGYLIDYSEEKMIETMNMIMKHTSERLNDFKKNNIELVESKYSWAKLAQDLIQ